VELPASLGPCPHYISQNLGRSTRLQTARRILTLSSEISAYFEGVKSYLSGYALTKGRLSCLLYTSFILYTPILCLYFPFFPLGYPFYLYVPTALERDCIPRVSESRLGGFLPDAQEASLAQIFGPFLPLLYLDLLLLDISIVWVVFSLFPALNLSVLLTMCLSRVNIILLLLH
jgi:hypothetical protein